MAYADSKKKNEEETVVVPTGIGNTTNTYHIIERNHHIVSGTATGYDFKKPVHFHGESGAEHVMAQSHIHMKTEFGRDNPQRWTHGQRMMLIPFFEHTAGDKFTRVAAELPHELSEADRHKYQPEQPIGTSRLQDTTRKQRVGIEQTFAYGEEQTILVGSGVLDEIKSSHRRDITESDRDVSSSVKVMPHQRNIIKNRLGRNYQIVHDNLNNKSKYPGFSVADKTGEDLIGFHNLEGHREVKGVPVRSIAHKPVWVQPPGNFIKTKMFRTFGSGEEATSPAYFGYSPRTHKTTAHLTGNEKQLNDLIDSRDMSRFVVRNARHSHHKALAHDFTVIANGFDERINKLTKGKKKGRG